MIDEGSAPVRAGRGGVVLFVLAASQFLMTLDTSVMNVSIRQVAHDVGTDVTGIQTAITLYTLVMASFMITGAKIGALIGRKRAFAIGLVVYGAGSLTTSLSHSLPVLLFGWSILEGLGAALILPAIVALVASNFAPFRRPAIYGLIAAAGAVAVAVGPLVGGALTTYASWRWVFAGEVVLVAVIVPTLRKVEEGPPAERTRFDVVGAVLSVVGLSLTVFGVLRSGDWGWVKPRPGGPTLFGVSPVVWLITGGLLVLFALVEWETHVARRGREPLVRTSMLRNARLGGGLAMFFFQFFIQAGVFFAIPLYLSVVLELSAVQTGVRILPLSIALLITALGVPRLLPRASPRRVTQVGLALMLAGTLVFIGGLSPDAGAGIVAVPMLLIGLGIGALASQLGAVVVAAVSADETSEVGGLQNTVTNFGASLGTALVGAVLIGTLTAGLVHGVESSTVIPPEAKTAYTVQMASGVPFTSDSDLRKQLEAASVPPATVDEILAVNSASRLDALRDALGVVALAALLGLFFTGLLPTRPVAERVEGDEGDVVEPADAAAAAG